MQDSIDRRAFMRKPRRFRVWLTCGCSILLTDRAMRPGSKFGCAGTGHGYHLSWVRWVDETTGRTGINASI